jgi:cytochrome c oxidase assembly protein subunit 15
VTTVRRLALASVVANSVLVVTGGAVRLTSSGLGCPTWPRCTSGSYVNQPEYGVHGIIEFGNRMLTFVLTVVVVALVVAALRVRPRRRDVVRLAVLGALGVPAQAVLGGITVHTKLNPWTVMAHFLLSMVLIGTAVVLHRRVQEGDAPLRSLVRAPLRQLSAALLALTAATLVVGTVVTGSGPHSGDAAAARTGFDPAAVSQLHADLVFLLVGATVGMWFALRATGGPSAAVRAAGVLLAVELAQGVVGFVQYFTHLPIAVVAVHLAGACATLVAAVRVVLATRARGPLPAAPLPADDERALQPV